MNNDSKIMARKLAASMLEWFILAQNPAITVKRAEVSLHEVTTNFILGASIGGSNFVAEIAAAIERAAKSASEAPTGPQDATKPAPTLFDDAEAAMVLHGTYAELAALTPEDLVKARDAVLLAVRENETEKRDASDTVCQCQYCRARRARFN